jgi:hypothetical protein
LEDILILNQALTQKSGAREWYNHYRVSSLVADIPQSIKALESSEELEKPLTQGGTDSTRREDYVPTRDRTRRASFFSSPEDKFNTLFPVRGSKVDASKLEPSKDRPSFGRLVCNKPDWSIKD